MKEIIKCKNASTIAAVLQYACSYSTEFLLKSLKQLQANEVAFKALLEKIKALTGLEPKQPSGTKDIRSEVENEV